MFVNMSPPLDRFLFARRGALIDGVMKLLVRRPVRGRGKKQPRNSLDNKYGACTSHDCLSVTRRVGCEYSESAAGMKDDRQDA
jgi:hypothetical protein